MYFDAKASNWDTEKRIERSKAIAEEISKAVKIESHFHAMEFGCGTGLISFNLINSLESITLIDISKGMIDVVNQKIQDNHVKNMTALYTDINKEIGIIGKFDIIYTSMALHHIKDTETTLRNLYDLLNDGGYLCIIDLTEDDGTFHKHDKGFDGHNGFNQNNLKNLLGYIGLQEVTSNEFYKGENIVEGEILKYTLFLMVGKKR